MTDRQPGPGLAGRDRGVPGVPARLRGHAGRDSARGRDPAARGAPPVRPGRRTGAAEDRGGQPHRLVQGPGHDHGHLQGGRGGGEGGRLRLHRQHLGLGRRLQRPGRPHLRGAHPRGPHRPGQAGPGPDPRRQGPAAAGQLRPGPRDRPGARRPGAGHGRQLGQPLPDRGPEVRRLRDHRPAGRRARGPLHPRRATPATSPPTGRAISSSRRRVAPPGCRGCSGFQAAGAAPIVAGHPIEHPETVATAIRIGNPASWYGATSAASESGGGIAAVTDDEILEAYRFLATEESVFCEPASAASVAGILTHGLPDGVGPVVDGGLRPDRPRPEGPGHRHQPDQRAHGGRRRPRRRPPGTRPLTGEYGGSEVVLTGGHRVVAASGPEPVCWCHLRFRNRPARACGRDLLVRDSRPARAQRRGEMSPGSVPDFPPPHPLIPWLWDFSHPPTRTC